jgi:hypothetical protein
MTSPGHPPLKCPTTQATNHTSTATPAGPTAGRGAPKVAARQGAPTAVIPDPHAGREVRLIGWLHIELPTSWRKVPRAISHCECGRHLTAQGHDQVIALVKDHADHRTRCLLHTAPERSRAA